MRIFRGPPSLLFVVSLLSHSKVVAHEPEVQLPFDRPHALERPEVHAHLGWESRYFLEGRDVLDGDSLTFGGIEMGWEHLRAGVWYGYSPDQRYDELQLSLALSQSIGDFEFYGAYTHFRFPFEDSHDDEIGVGFVWSGLPMDLEFSADLYYSFDADGYFTEIAIGREFAMSDRLGFNFSVPFGINRGYISDGHDGANNIALSIGLEYAFSELISVTAHTAYSWALSKDSSFAGDDQLIDFFHGGIGLQWSF